MQMIKSLLWWKCFYQKEKICIYQFTEAIPIFRPGSWLSAEWFPLISEGCSKEETIKPWYRCFKRSLKESLVPTPTLLQNHLPGSIKASLLVRTAERWVISCQVRYWFSLLYISRIVILAKIKLGNNIPGVPGAPWGKGGKEWLWLRKGTKCP